MKCSLLAQLENKAKSISQEILRHNFFKLQRDFAIEYLVTRYETSKVILSDYFSKKYEVDILPETLSFIFQNLQDSAILEQPRIDVKELNLLIENIYSYLEFKKFLELCKHGIVKVVNCSGIIRFEYTKETYLINDIYNGYWHTKEQQQALKYSRSLRGITEKMFDLTVEISIGDFTLNEYKIFCQGLDSIIEIEYSNPLKVANKIGYLKLSKDQWIEKLSGLISLNDEKIGQIIDFCIYDFENPISDPRLSYFIPIQDKLLFSFSIFSSQRLDKNLLRLLSAKEPSFYQNEQKKLELHQINLLREKDLEGYEFDTDKDGSPGEDLIVYDKIANAVHVIELKYKLSVDSINEIRNLKKLLSKAGKQNTIAKTKLNVDNIFEKFFNNKYIGQHPDKIIFFSLTNYSIDYTAPNSILLSQHYFELLKNASCTNRLEKIIEDKYRGINMSPKVKYKKINLFGYIIKLPRVYSEIPKYRELKL